MINKLSKEENEEYISLRGIFSPTKPQLARLNELREKMGQKDMGFFKMSDAERGAAIQKDKEESMKRKADNDMYKVSQKKMPGEKTYDRDCPSFGEE